MLILIIKCWKRKERKGKARKLEKDMYSSSSDHQFDYDDIDSDMSEICSIDDNPDDSIWEQGAAWLSDEDEIEYVAGCESAVKRINTEKSIKELTHSSNNDAMGFASEGDVGENTTVPAASQRKPSEFREQV